MYFLFEDIYSDGVQCTVCNVWCAFIAYYTILNGFFAISSRIRIESRMCLNIFAGMRFIIPKLYSICGALFIVLNAQSNRINIHNRYSSRPINKRASANRKSNENLKNVCIQPRITTRQTNLLCTLNKHIELTNRPTANWHNY